MEPMLDMDEAYAPAKMAKSKPTSAPRSRPAPSPGPMPLAAEAPAMPTGGGAVGGLYMPPAPPPPPPVATNTEHYTDYGINGFTDAGQDNLSTFAVDVDTASYTMVRRKLREGYLPASSAVRVEEFVNYFPYEYAQPERGTPFAVDFEASPSPYNSLNTLVRVGVQGKHVAFDERKSVHLTFLVDVSGSMQSNDKMGLVKKTLKMLTEELEDGDTVAIATYAGRTDVILPPTPISKSGTILKALDGLTAGGSTAMGAGIDLAYAQADASFVDGAVNRVIVCSDGDANVGQTSHDALSKKIRGFAEKGITLTTVGFGTGNYKDTMMERLANDGDGNYYYIDSEREARRVFVDKLTGTLEVIAKDVKIQVEWDPEDVLAYRLIGYENRDVADKDFRNDKVDAGEIGAGHQVTALYEVALKDKPKGSIATVHVRNKAPGPDAPAVERSFDLDVREISGTFAATSRQFRIATAAAGFAELLRHSPHMQEIGYRDVEAIARGAARAEYAEDKELIELIDRAADLNGEGAFVQR
ncbi:MAG: VWA domain-containing protein [Deltaproteobacteria bacterium]|nr:MAG: VWA domain-containing protein [Deltaproteobacteria bacterium]